MQEHILFYQIDSSVYKKLPRVRFYADGQLIDEHDLTHQEQTSHTSLQETLKITDNARFFYLPKIKERLHLCWEIKNDDNNYTNGFMTKSTTIWFKNLAIIPNKLMNNYKKYYSRWFYKRQRHGDDSQTRTREFRDWWLNIPQLGHNHVRHLKWTDNNGTIDYSDTVDSIGGARLGTTGKFTIDYKKKFWCMIPATCKTGHMRIADPYDMEAIFTKYNQYEDQRDSN